MSTGVLRWKVVFVSGWIAAVACSTAGPGEEDTPSPVRATLPTLPTQPYGSLKGAFSVSANGSATYSLPLQVPPGRAGIQPEFSLRYESGAGVGVLGVGWRLEGGSRIARCNKLDAVQQHLRKIKFDGQDAFCLDGEPLVEVPATASHGGIEFRTERDSRRRVIAFPSVADRLAPTWDVIRFEVDLPDGRIAHYGNTPDSKVAAPSQGKTRAWSIADQVDRFGNHIRYVYSKRSSLAHPALLGEDTEQILAYVSYGENDGTGGGAKLKSERRVAFDYQDLSLAEVAFARGGTVNVTARLKSIRMEIGGSTKLSYELQYDLSPATGRDRLTSIRQCDGLGVCLPAIALEYESALPTFGPAEDVPAHPNPTPLEGLAPFLADLNGDGLPDIVTYELSPNLIWKQVQLLSTRMDSTGRISVGSPVNAPTWFHHRLLTEAAGPEPQFSVADIDGDGVMDLQSPMEGTAPFQLTWIGGNATVHTISTPFHPWLRPTDLTGDGIVDLVHCELGTMVFGILPGASGGRFPGPELTTTLDCSDNYALYAGPDSDGDGAMEMLWGRYPTRPLMSGSAPDGAFFMRSIPAHLYTGDIAKNGFVLTTADFNSDGLQDFITNAGDVWLNSGLDLVGEPSGVRVGSGLAGDLFLDFNRDGKADLVRHSAAGTDITLTRDIWATGTAKTVATIHTPATCSPPGGAYYSPNFVDINNDGLLDLVCLESQARTLRVFRQTSKVPDLLRLVREGDPTVATYDIRYTGGGDQAHYTKTPACTSQYPTLCTVNAGMVVSDLLLDAGPAYPTPRHLEYLYENHRRDARGRGNLGYDKVTIREIERHTDQILEYDNITRTPSGRYPFSGRIKRSSTQTYLPVSSATSHYVVDRVATDFGYLELNGASGPYVSYSRSSTSSHLEGPSFEDRYLLLLGASSAKVETLDGMGFPTRITRKVVDGPTTVMTIGYSNDVNRWFVGRPTTLSETATWNGASHSRDFAWTFHATTGWLATERIRPPGDPKSLLKTFGPDSYGNLKSIVVAAPNAPSRTWLVDFLDGEFMFPTSSTNPLLQVTQAAFNAVFGKETRVTDPNGELVDLAYDGLGRLRQVVGPDGSSTAFDYQAPASGVRSLFAVAVKPPGSPSTVTEIDRLGHPVRRTFAGLDGTEQQQIFGYDRFGRRNVEYDPFPTGQAPTSYVSRSFYEDGRPESENVRGAISTRVYGIPMAVAGRTARGRSVVSYDPNGQSTTALIHPAGWLEKSTDATGGETKFEYWPFGSLRSVSDPALNVTSIVFDAYDYRTSVSDPDTGLTTLDTNAFGELTGSTDGAGVATSFEYDQLGRLRRRSSPGASAVWLYDAPSSGPGCAASVPSSNATTHSIGRLTCAQSRDGNSTVVDYDSSGRTSAVPTRRAPS